MSERSTSTHAKTFAVLDADAARMFVIRGRVVSDVDRVSESLDLLGPHVRASFRRARWAGFIVGVGVGLALARLTRRSTRR